jgi:ABC-2 type transport system ATP-binding protein
MKEILAQLQNVHKRFGSIQALTNMNIEIFKGEILALLGPNGAGKTTVISILLGRRKPNQGKALLYSQNPRVPKSRYKIGATPQETGFPNNLTVIEIIELVQSHFTNSMSVDTLLSQLKLEKVKRRQIGGLSGGQQRRLAIALAFVGNPELVFLDEPTTGLDVESRHTLWQVIKGYHQKKKTVLLTTHYIEEAETLASRIVVISKGKIIAQGTVEEIKALVHFNKVRFKSDKVPDLPGVERIEQKDTTFTLYTRDTDELIRTIVRQNVNFKDIEIIQTNLEDAFLELTKE